MSEAKVWEGTVLTVRNRHIEGCGRPPNLATGRAYTAYFENRYGEQLVFQYDPEERKGVLWHGDCSWEHPVEVMAGGTTLVLSAEEHEWLRLVWGVATEGESREFHLHSAMALTRAWIAVYDGLLSRPEFAADGSLRRGLLKQKRKLERQEEALITELIEAQAEEAAGRGG